MSVVLDAIRIIRIFAGFQLQEQFSRTLDAVAFDNNFTVAVHVDQWNLLLFGHSTNNVRILAMSVNKVPRTIEFTTHHRSEQHRISPLSLYVGDEPYQIIAIVR